jgi:dienelactone hydrolase
MSDALIASERLSDFELLSISLLGQTKRVYKAGSGPAVIVMTEMPGIYGLVVEFARKVRDAGFTVWMPHLFGEVGRAPTTGYLLKSMAKTCISREFAIFAANRSSPVVDWLKALSAHVHPLCGGKGVGAIGMCFTGNFALSMMVEPSMLAAVLSQPSLPLLQKGGMHISAADLRCVKDRLDKEDLTVLAYRFAGDRFCGATRFADYAAALGDRFQGSVLPDESASTDSGVPPHSVVTRHLIDEEGEPTRAAVDEILAFYQKRLLD